jgi:hypothetical protein
MIYGIWKRGKGIRIETRGERKEEERSGTEGMLAPDAYLRVVDWDKISNISRRQPLSDEPKG